MEAKVPEIIRFMQRYMLFPPGPKHLGARGPPASHLVALAERIADSLYGRLGLEVLVVQESGADAGEDARNPGDIVADLPDGDTRAEVVLKAGLNDEGVLRGPARIGGSADTPEATRAALTEWQGPQPRLGRW